MKEELNETKEETVEEITKEEEELNQRLKKVVDEYIRLGLVEEVKVSKEGYLIVSKEEYDDWEW